MAHVVVLVTSSYPRFPGDGVGSFMEPIAKGLAARGHEVHLVAPWHPAITRGKSEDGVWFHFFHYAPIASLNVFGYASGLRADTHLRSSAWLVAPLALAAGTFKAWRVAVKKRATIMHGHWIVPGGVIAAAAARGLPLVMSAHGSDVFVAEHSGAVRRIVGHALHRAAGVTACSANLRDRTVRLGAAPEKTRVVPYGVDTNRFAPDASARSAVRRGLGVPDDARLVVAAGRLVAKKGFEYVIDATRALAAAHPSVRVVIAGAGDLQPALETRAAALGPHVILAGNRSQDEVAQLFAAADVIAVPSIRDDAGNVDGLPNTALEALASGTPVVATRAGGLSTVVIDGVTGRLVAERDAAGLATAIGDLLSSPTSGRALGDAGRALVTRDFSWGRVARQFEEIYDSVRPC